MAVEKFWNEIKDVHAGMLAIGSARHVPMSPYPREADQAIWFITAQGTALVKAIEEGEHAASLILTGAGEMHARIEGDAVLVQDRAKLEELWSPVADAWFDGIDDPDVRLICLRPRAAEVWLTPSMLGFAYEIVKSKVTGAEPDMGEHLTLVF